AWPVPSKPCAERPAHHQSTALTIAGCGAARHKRPSMWAYLIIGLLLGLVAMFVPLARARRKADRSEEENQKLAQDRQRLIDFMHLMTEALGEGLSRQELHQRI